MARIGGAGWAVAGAAGGVVAAGGRGAGVVEVTGGLAPGVGSAAAASVLVPVVVVASVSELTMKVELAMGSVVAVVAAVAVVAVVAVVAAGVETVTAFWPT